MPGTYLTHQQQETTGGKLPARRQAGVAAMKKFSAGNTAPGFLKCQNGGIMITWAILLPAIIGMMGLGLETGNWYLAKRNLQAVADAAAIAGAYETTASARTTSATNAVAANGFGNGSNVTITVNNPPRSGNYTSNTSAVEVLLSQPQTMMFSALFLNQSPTITVRAVALPKTSPPNDGIGGCIVALDPSGSSDFDMSGGATINATNCFMASNSNNSQAIKMTGGATMNVDGLYTMGNYTLSGGAELNSTNAPIVDALSPIADPYQNLSIPSYSGCDHNQYSLNGGKTATLSPGVYCNGISLNGGSTATLQPGVYIIDRGTLSVNGGNTLTGNGVTIILTSSTGSDYATASINGGANVTLSAPTSGTDAGVAIYQDRNAPIDSSSSFNGGSTMNVTGAIYFPHGELSFTGGNSTSSPSCTQVIAWSLNFSGGTNLSGNCPNSGMSKITTPVSGSVTLVE
ncbi:MAG: hypothetical protein KGI29_01155 [Pseudomonadota bacterium]|nr:hypothetical protein [Pseudomonadota bacterium]MDE3038602.1 hypothetical protein [Pseudomonadota bacterium]